MNMVVSIHVICILLIGTIALAALWISKSYADIRYWKKKATTKHISGLPNHLGLELLGSKLFSQLHRGIFESITLIFIDIDGFKEINDSCGHQVGDRVIASFGALITSNIRTYDVVSIISNPGGDEFIILMSNCSIEQADTHMKTLCMRSEQELDISFTYGIASTQEQEEESSLTSLIEIADMRMNRHKVRRGKR